MTADRGKCGICQFALDGTETENALLCGHTYHRYCIDSYATHKMISLENLECPVCKQTASQINALVHQAFGEDGDEPADTVLEVPDDDIPVPVPEDAPPPAPATRTRHRARPRWRCLVA